MVSKDTSEYCSILRPLKEPDVLRQELRPTTEVRPFPVTHVSVVLFDSLTRTSGSFFLQLAVDRSRA